MTRIASIASIVTLVALVAGCGATAFSPHFPDNELQDLKKATEGLQAQDEATPVNKLGKPLALIVTESPAAIVAYDLEDNRVVWKQEAEVTSRILVAKDRVFHQVGKGELVARRIEDGDILWTTELAEGDRLVGMATDGRDLYYVSELAKRSIGGIAAYLVATDGRSGSTRWIRSSGGRLGAPAVEDGRVFLPLRFQSIAIVSAEDGSELARIRSKEETLLWVRTSPAGILYGGKSGVYKLDENAVTGTKEGSSFISAPLPESVRPVY
jgi:outer membrane protein assembly factor BamB